MSQDSKNKFVNFNFGQVVEKFEETPRAEGEKPTFELKLGPSRNHKTGQIYGENIFPITLANGMQLNEGDIMRMWDLHKQNQQKVDNQKMSRATFEAIAFKRYDVQIGILVDENGKQVPRKKKNDDKPSSNGSGVDF